MHNVIFFQYFFMNIKTSSIPATLFRGMIRALYLRLTQHPEFYNIRHYTKNKGRRRNRQKIWWIRMKKILNSISEFTLIWKEWLCYC